MYCEIIATRRNVEIIIALWYTATCLPIILLLRCAAINRPSMSTRKLIISVAESSILHFVYQTRRLNSHVIISGVLRRCYIIIINTSYRTPLLIIRLYTVHAF